MGSLQALSDSVSFGRRRLETPLRRQRVFQLPGQVLHPDASSRKLLLQQLLRTQMLALAILLAQPRRLQLRPSLQHLLVCTFLGVLAHLELPSKRFGLGLPQVESSVPQ